MIHVIAYRLSLTYHLRIETYSSSVHSLFRLAFPLFLYTVEFDDS